MLATTSKLDLVRQGLRDEIGYSEPNGIIIENYNFVVEDGEVFTADLVAFADTKRFDISTACIAAHQWSSEQGTKEELVDHFSYLGVPLVVVVQPEYAELYETVYSRENNERKPLATWEYSRLNEYFSDLKNDLSPSSIDAVKRAGKQLSFFAIDPHLQQFAREATQHLLVDCFREAIESIPLEVREDHPKELSQIAIWILAARILQDKLIDDSTLQVRDISILFDALMAKFPNYFKDLHKTIQIIGKGTVEILYTHLLAFSFRSLTNEMLAYFYENTLVTEEMRRSLGIHYTPQFLAERILKRLPIESLRPEQRITMDATSGSGNLLLASFNRLKNLLPVQMSIYERHQYLLNHIIGTDIDSFACEIARLSLLIHDLPAGDSWDIHTKDVYQLQPQQFFGKRPNIIVGNPPFYGTRNTEIAAEVLSKYIDWLAPGGFLGVVMPLTFLENSGQSQITRKHLLENCDILELWHLPAHTIPSSSASIVVILARKLNPGEVKQADLTRIEKVSRLELGYFKKNGKVSRTYVQSQQIWESSESYLMTSSPYDEIWKRIEEKFVPIHPQYANLKNGVKFGSGIAYITDENGKEIKDENGKPIINEENFRFDVNVDGWERVLFNNRTRKIFEPYALYWKDQEVRYIRYPNADLERERKPEDFKKDKVVINATRNADSGWRIYGALDENQLVPSKNFHIALPAEATLEEIMAVINSSISNAWFGSKNAQRHIRLQTLKQLPFPEFTRTQKHAIVQLVRDIAELKANKELLESNKSAIQKYIFILDEIVFDAYDLNTTERGHIVAYLAQFKRPGSEWDKVDIAEDTFRENVYSGQLWKIIGQVQQVNSVNETAVLWLDGEEVEISIPSSMPGWALRSQTAFEAYVPRNQAGKVAPSNLDWIDFQPLGYGYLTEDEWTLAFI